MKKTLIFVLTMATLATISTAQNTPTRSFRIGYGYVGGAVDLYSVTSMNPIYSAGLLSMQADVLEVTPRITLGGHLALGGACMYDEVAIADTTPSLSQTYIPRTLKNSIGLHFGMDLSYHVLSASHWDVSVNATLGSYWTPNLTPQAECGLGTTVTYYPLQHIGIYGDLSWGHFRYNSFRFPMVGTGNTKLGLGISYRF